jgi:hypothetical protein
MDSMWIQTRALPAIDLEEDDEINYLARKYGVTPARVREVTREVGTTYAAVEETLARSDPHASD